MAKCDLIETCIFFNDQMQNMPSTAAVYKELYCEKNFDRCARLMIVKTLGRGQVPKDLFPNQAEWAEAIIKGSAA